jgi:hypothetical protein
MSTTEQRLLRTARACLASGRLPRVQSQCIWGGYGRGDVCSLCGEPIRSNEVEFEVPEADSGARAAFKFHITCHDAWQLECGLDESVPARTG